MISEFSHETVLRQETVDAVIPAPALWEKLAQEQQPLRIVDCTLGGAGHALCLIETLDRHGILEKVPLRLVGIDRDADALAVASARIAALGHAQVTFEPLRCSFGTLGEAWHERQAHEPIHGLYADFGVSSPQIDRPERGFSLRLEGPLDMRMDKDASLTARTLLESCSESELGRIFQEYGEEPRGRKLAKAIVGDRESGRVPLDSTLAFAKYAERVLAYHGSRTPPATRIFQALRIAVNDELGEIEALLRIVPTLVSDQAKVAFISFHSLEDRIVKRYFRAWENALPEPPRSSQPEAPIFPHLEKRTWGKEIPRGGVVPGTDELERNSRSHSARLRAFCFGEKNGRQ